MGRIEFCPEALIELANRCRHIETTAEHIAGMIDAPHVDVVTALWTDLMEHGARLVDEQEA